MFPAKRHLLPVLHPHPVRKPVRVPRHAPVGAVFDLRDGEVDRFGALGGRVLDDEAHDAGGVEVVGGERGEDGAVPVCEGGLGEGGEGAGHGGEEREGWRGG